MHSSNKEDGTWTEVFADHLTEVFKLNQNQLDDQLETIENLISYSERDRQWNQNQPKLGMGHQGEKSMFNIDINIINNYQWDWNIDGVQNYNTN